MPMVVGIMSWWKIHDGCGVGVGFIQREEIIDVAAIVIRIAKTIVRGCCNRV